MYSIRRLTLAAVLIVALVAGNLPVSAQSAGRPPTFAPLPLKTSKSRRSASSSKPGTCCKRAQTIGR